MSHLTIAASEKAFGELFAVLRDGFKWSDAKTFNFGSYVVGYDVEIELKGGKVDLQNDNTVTISELDIKWKVLKLTIGFDLPEYCVGGWCWAWAPTFKGWQCVAKVPKICAFSKNPDVSKTLDLSGLVTSEVSLAASLVANYQVNHPASVSYLDAQLSGTANQWQVFLVPKWLDVDPIDVADTAGDLLMNTLTTAIQALLPGPQWAKDLILAWLGPIVDKIRDILDLPDDIAEWFSDLLNVSFGLGNLIAQAILTYLAIQKPLIEIEDPYPILPASGGLIPVKIPIEDLTVRVTDDEMIVEANVGA
jgi:hypothetical protein